MKSIINVLILILAVIFASPAMVGILDMMFWFYTSNTYTDLDWAGGRGLAAMASTFLSFVLIMWVAIT